MLCEIWNYSLCGNDMTWGVPGRIRLPNDRGDLVDIADFKALQEFVGKYEVIDIRVRKENHGPIGISRLSLQLPTSYSLLPIDNYTPRKRLMKNDALWQRVKEVFRLNEET